MRAMRTRAGWKASEVGVGADLNAGGSKFSEQVVFKGGKRLDWAKNRPPPPGSTRVDWTNGSDRAVEVKNWDVFNNKDDLIRNAAAAQAVERAEHLPAGMKQEVVVDVRGPAVDRATRDDIVKQIKSQSGGAVTTVSFKE